MPKNPYFDDDDDPTTAGAWGDEAPVASGGGQPALPEWTQITADIADTPPAPPAAPIAPPPPPPAPPAPPMPPQPIAPQAPVLPPQQYAQPPQGYAPVAAPVYPPPVDPNQVPAYPAQPQMPVLPQQPMPPQPSMDAAAVAAKEAELAAERARVEEQAREIERLRQRELDAEWERERERQRGGRRPAGPAPIVDPVGPRFDEPDTSEEPVTGKGRRGKKPPAPKKTKKARVGGRTSTAGGRGKLLFLRGTIYAVLFLIMFVGLKHIVFPTPVPVDKIQQQIADGLGIKGFPVEEGQALATRFAREYLTIDPDLAPVREDVLGAMLQENPDSVGASWLNVSAVVGDPETPADDPVQHIYGGPILAAQPDQIDENYAQYTFAVQVGDPKLIKGDPTNPPKWVYLAVTVYAADDGSLAVAGPPAFVPAPRVAGTRDEVPFKPLTDTAQVDALRARLNGFFKSWSADPTNDAQKVDYDNLGGFLAEGADASAKHGLLGSATLVPESLNVTVEDVDIPTTPREARVTLNWQFGGSEFEQSYRVTVVQDASGQWFVKSVAGGSLTLLNN